MSRFKKAVAILAEHCPLPLFTEMRDDGVPRPLALDVGKAALGFVGVGHKRAVKKALGLLTHSRRYLEATAAVGAMRHNTSGTPVAPVSDAHRRWAEARLEEKRLHYVKRQQGKLTLLDAIEMLSPAQRTAWATDLATFGCAMLQVRADGQVRVLNPAIVEDRKLATHYHDVPGKPLQLDVPVERERGR